MFGKIAHKKMWGKRWGKSVIDKQKSLVNQGFFLLFRCPLHGFVRTFHIENKQKC